MDLLVQKCLPAGMLIYLTPAAVRVVRRDVDDILTAAKA